MHEMEYARLVGKATGIFESIMIQGCLSDFNKDRIVAFLQEVTQTSDGDYFCNSCRYIHNKDLVPPSQCEACEKLVCAKTSYLCEICDKGWCNACSQKGVFNEWFEKEEGRYICSTCAESLEARNDYASRANKGDN